MVERASYMRIIDKNKDFYDYASAYGVDPNIVYVRKAIDFTVDRKEKFRGFYLNAKAWNDPKPKYVYVVNVFICGTRFKIFYEDQNFSSPSLKIPYETERTWILVGKELSESNAEIDYSHVNEKYNSPIVVFGAEIVFRIKKSDYSEVTDIIDYARYNGDSVITNAAILKYLGVQNFISAEEVWMKISNWISSRNEKEMIELSDKDKIVKAGFDKIKSFRKMKDD